MGKYIKLFDTHADYATYIGGANKILPNVSYCKDNTDIHYNPWTETRIVGKFNVTDTSSATNIMYKNAASQFSEIEIDGVVQPSVVRSYTFDTTGEHTVKYTLTDPTSIGYDAFEGCTGLTSVTIPDSVTTIGNNAFYGCNGLTSITIPNTVTSISEAAFYFCYGLTSIGHVGSGASVEIPDSVTTIANYAFEQCTGLTSITIPNTVTTIGTYAFDGCSGLTSLTIGNNVTTIGNNAFRGCTGLTNVTIPNSVTSISYQVFDGCTGLTSVTIGNSVTSIGSGAFSGCSSLESITSMATTAPTIQSSTFQSVKTGGTLTVPSGSTGYDVWMGTGNYYLGKYSWTKVEQ